MKEEQEIRVLTPALLRDAVFLAGPCARSGAGARRCGWRGDAVEALRSAGFTGLVIDPTDTDLWSADANTRLEAALMDMCGAIMFWIPRSKDNPCLYTNVEFGIWYRSAKAWFGWPAEAEANAYLAARLRMAGRHYSLSLDALARDVVDYLWCARDGKLAD